MNILIGISGGISAYKIADLVRLFIKDGHKVKTVLTKNAQKFITPVTLETLSKERAYTDLFSDVKDVKHIELSKWADILVLAPATANTIAKIINGMCDDLLSSIVMAIDKPCYIFPSMNTNMFTHPATQANIEKLRGWGYLVYEPDEGELACGDTGKGRLPDVALIYDIVMGEIERAEIDSILSDKKVIVTAGSTKAYIDPVRYIVNNSSGTMGVQIAREAWLRGANVSLVCNKEVVDNFPTVLYYADDVYIVETTDEAYETINKIYDECEVYISAAAFCDFSSSPQAKKIKKSEISGSIFLKPAVDIFKEISKRKKQQVMVGFALESDDMEDNAKSKLKEKNMDLVIANSIDAIGAKSSSVAIMDNKGIRTYIKDTDKKVIANSILIEIERLFLEKHKDDKKEEKNEDNKEKTRNS